MRGICTHFDALEAMREKKERLAVWVRENYLIATNVKGDPLWLILANKRVAFLLGETHFFAPHCELNSIFCRSISGDKVYLTEGKPPSRHQIRVEGHAVIVRWENPELRRNLDAVVVPILEWRTGLISYFEQVKKSTDSAFHSNIRIFARIMSKRFPEYVPFVDRVCGMTSREVVEKRKELTVTSYFHCVLGLLAIDEQLTTLFAATNSKRELFLARKCAGSIQAQVQPIVIAGSAHVHAKEEGRTLSHLAAMGVFYLALVPKVAKKVLLAHQL